MPDRPNILVIMTDHQRADSIGMVQCGVEVAPCLDRLAREAAVFERAYTTSPLCVPARTALATGKYPTRNGVVFNDWRGVRAGDHQTIHELLKSAGYAVGHVGVHHVRVRPEMRERLDFETWVDSSDHVRHLQTVGVDIAPPEGWGAFRPEFVENHEGRPVKVRYSNVRTARWPGPAEHFKDSWFCRKAAEFIRRKRTRPFALFVNLWAPHPPLRVPEPYYSRFDPDGIELPDNVGVPADAEPPGRRRGVSAQLAEGVAPEEWRRAWAAHLGLVSLADEGIGRILEALDGSGLADDTVVLFTVDHGEQLGQHRMYQKMEMYEPAIRVPLMFRVPGTGRPVFRGVIEGPVSHLGIMPTLLELAGVPVPDDLDGESLLDCITSGAPPPEEAVFSQYSGNPTVGDIRRAVLTRRYKYVYDPADEPELYDLEDDPLEMRNLAPDPAHREVLLDLHGRCRAWAEAHGDWVDFAAL